MKRFTLSHNKLFEKNFHQFISNWHNIKTIFDDFLNLTISAFSQDELLYQSIISKYSNSEIELFATTLSDLIFLMESDLKHDVLWDFYEKHISLWHNWQFFTPQHICEFMAQATMVDNDDWKTVIDPCCWSGKMLLAHLKYSKHKFYYYWSDIDRTCCLMSVINLFLNWANGEIYWMNALTHNIWEWWRFGFKWFIPYLVKLDLEDKDVKETAKLVSEQQEIQLKKYDQQSLF